MVRDSHNLTENPHCRGDKQLRRATFGERKRIPCLPIFISPIKLEEKLGGPAPLTNAEETKLEEKVLQRRKGERAITTPNINIRSTSKVFKVHLL